MDNPYEALKLEHQLCFRLYAVSRNMTRLYQDLLEPFNITYPQYIILLVLFEHGEIDFKELSDKVDLKTGTMTPIIQKLEEMGYLTKEKNPSDMRRLNVSLTDKGRHLKEQIIHVPYELSKRLKMSYESYVTLIQQLDELAKTIDQAQKADGFSYER